MVLAVTLASVISPPWSKFYSIFGHLSRGMDLLNIAHRYIRTLYSSPVLQYQPAQLTVSLACVLYLISSFDLIDPWKPDVDTRSQVVQCFHDLQLYANDHWLDHLSALANSPADLTAIGSSMPSLRQGLERLTERHNELVKTKALNDEDDRDSLPSAKEAGWHRLGVSRATQSLLNKVLGYRSKPTESDQIASCSCMYTGNISLSVSCYTDYGPS